MLNSEFFPVFRGHPMSDLLPLLEAADLHKSYRLPHKTVQVLKGAALTIDPMERVAIMGRSGSGKSTLLHQLSLIDTPSSGSIMIDGADVLRLNDSQKTSYRLSELGYVFQEYALIVEFTALENVYLPAMALGTDKAAYVKRATELLEVVDLGGRLHHYPHELSGGEQQRVAIARSLINSPKVLFADEPSANLDSASAKTVLELFQRLNQELKQTIVMITHEEDDRKYVHRIIWLKDGLIDKIEIVS
jgi:putative ABC transport system ATP-binding protein